jgi:Flp pilus assembly protein TadD
MALRRTSWAIVFCMAVRLGAQFQPPLEAETPEEFDSYLTVEEAAAGRETLARSDTFQKQWPASKLLPRVWELRFFAWQKLGQAAEARRAGEEALALAPGNLTVRAALAVQLASEDVGAAERHAQTVLDELAKTKLRRGVPLAQYETTAAKLRSQAHVALGLVKFRRGDATGALTELETADRLAPEPALSYRLGRLYAALGRTAEARRRLTEAAQAADPALAERGRAALAELP